MQDFEEKQQNKHDLIMPEDLLGDEEDLNDYGDAIDDQMEEEAE
jgi:hypothetical protein